MQMISGKRKQSGRHKEHMLHSGNGEFACCLNQSAIEMAGSADTVCGYVGAKSFPGTVARS